jgi:hypothetical protein
MLNEYACDRYVSFREKELNTSKKGDGERDLFHGKGYMCERCFIP